MERNVEIAWAAGLFEGEGCISHSQGCHHRIIINVSSTDRDVIERFAAIVGAGAIDTRRHQGLGWKTLWSWRASGDDAERIVLLLLPQFGERRRTRALELLAARTAHRDAATFERKCPGCGVYFRPPYYGACRKQTHCSTSCYDRTTGRELKRLSSARRRRRAGIPPRRKVTV